MIPRTPPPSRLALLIALTLTLTATSCANKPPTSQSDSDQQLMARFAAGASVLDCEGPCSAAYVYNQRDIWTRYDSQDWQGLALAILHTRWRRDITYFFLGSAAQGLGFPEAADRYYRIAATLATGPRAIDKCASIYELCGSLSLPRDIYPPLTAVDELLASRGKPVGRMPLTPGAQPPQPANGGWIDPPPLPR